MDNLAKVMVPLLPPRRNPQAKRAPNCPLQTRRKSTHRLVRRLAQGVNERVHHERVYRAVVTATKQGTISEHVNSRNVLSDPLPRSFWSPSLQRDTRRAGVLN